MNPSPKFDPSRIEYHREAAGLKKLNLVWAKLEILIGLSVAVVGFRFPIRHPEEAIAAGTLSVLGLYLAMAGHRSHIYLAMNRQTAYLLESTHRRTTLHERSEGD